METNDKSLPDVIITKQDKQAHFTINGNIYKGIRDLLPHANAKLIEMRNPKFVIYQHKYHNYILRRCEKYPCFDCHDYAHENRFYRRYMICSSKEEAIKKYNYIIEHDESFNMSSHNSSLLAPLIYADDDQPEIEILTSTAIEIINGELETNTKQDDKENIEEVYRDRFRNNITVNILNDGTFRKVTQTNKYSEFEFLGDTYSYDQLNSSETIKVYWDESRSKRELIKDQYGRLLHHRYDEEMNFDGGSDRLDILWTLVADEKDSDDLSHQGGLSLLRLPFIASAETNWVAAHEYTDSNFRDKITHPQLINFKSVISWLSNICKLNLS